MQLIIVLGGIDLLCCCCRASNTIFYYQYIHNMLLWACKKYCCCTYNIYEISLFITYIKSPWSIQVELGKEEGIWSVLQLLQQTLAKYLNVELWANWLLTWKGTNQLCLVSNDVIISDWVRPIGLRHLEFHDNFNSFGIMNQLWKLFYSIYLSRLLISTYVHTIEKNSCLHFLSNKFRLFMQGCIKLIKIDSKDFYNTTKDYFK